MRSWELVVGFIVSTVAVGIAATRYHSDPEFPPTATTSIESGRAYAIDTAEGSAAVDLEFAPGTEYRLIVSFLGNTAETSRVELTARSIDAAHRLAGREIKPLTNLRKSKSASGETEPASMRSPAAASRQHALRPSREFFLHVTEGSLDDPRQYARVKARLIRSGEYVRVYLDAQQSERDLHPGLADEIVRLFDDEIVPTTRRSLGGTRDVDGDGTFLILLSPWLSRLQGGRIALGGFVRGSDFQRESRAPFGNRCDMMYLNSNVLPGNNLKALLAHEYAHAVAFSARLASPTRPYRLADEDDWLNEAIAHLSENVHSAGFSNLDHRVHEFLESPESFPLAVPDYYSAGLWRSHGCRGATYLFLRWCVDQFGPRILAELIRSPAVGRRNIARVTGMPFAELYRRWTIAVAGVARVDGYQSLSLHGRLGRHSLSGPRTIDWNVEDAGPPLTLPGTATAYLRLRCGEAPAVKRIRVSTSGAARLQITVIRLPAVDPSPAAVARTGTADRSVRFSE